MKLKQMAIIFISLAFILTGCGTDNKNKDVEVISADYPYYESVDKLNEDTDAILKGYVISSKVREYNPNVNTVFPDNELANPGGEPSKYKDMVYTVYSVKITEVYKGKYSIGDEMEISQLGGKTKSKEVIYTNSIDLKISDKDEYVFFLNEIQGFPAEIMTPIQGCYKYVADKNEFKSVDKNNTFNLRIDDLSKIKEKNK